MASPIPFSFGGAGGSGFSGFFPWSSGPISLPSGRALGNGSTSCLMTLTSILVGGNGGAASGSANLAGSVGSFSAASGSPVSTTVSSANAVLVNGGSASISVTGSRSMNFGRAGGGTMNDGHTSFSGTLGGGGTYQQGPNAPTIGAVSSSTLGSATVAFTAATDDGGSAITRHRVEYSTNNFATVAGYVEGTTSPITIVGLTPGVVYYFRVSACNAVSDAAATTGAHSSTGSVTVVGGIKVGRSGSWVLCAVYVGVNGVWVPAQVFAGRSGSWVGLTT